MNILLTNDDGINAEGINSLFEALSSDHNVYIVAPFEEKSASSNAITIRDNLTLEKIDDRRYALNGFPADCVNVGLNAGIIPGIELVISGINHGPNLGDDVFFSGTVAGARTAFIFGTSGIAVSLDCLESSSFFADASRFILSFIGDIRRRSGTVLAFYNINYPDITADEVKGVRYTRLGRRKYSDSFRVVHNDETTQVLQLMGTIDSVAGKGTDIEELRSGYISITPLTLDCTDYEYLKRLR